MHACVAPPAGGTGGRAARSVANPWADPPQVGCNLDEQFGVGRVAVADGALGKPHLRSVRETEWLQGRRSTDETPQGTRERHTCPLVSSQVTCTRQWGGAWCASHRLRLSNSAVLARLYNAEPQTEKPTFNDTQPFPVRTDMIPCTTAVGLPLLPFGRRIVYMGDPLSPAHTAVESPTEAHHSTLALKVLAGLI